MLTAALWNNYASWNWVTSSPVNDILIIVGNKSHRNTLSEIWIDKKQFAENAPENIVSKLVGIFGNALNVLTYIAQSMGWEQRYEIIHNAYRFQFEIKRLRKSKKKVLHDWHLFVH